MVILRNPALSCSALRRRSPFPYRLRTSTRNLLGIASRKGADAQRTPRNQNMMTRMAGWSLSAAREPCSFAREPCSAAREPCSAAREPCSAAREPCSVAREPYSAAGQPFSVTEQPFSAVEHLSVAECRHDRQDSARDRRLIAAIAGRRSTVYSRTYRREYAPSFNRVLADVPPRVRAVVQPCTRGRTAASTRRRST